jgi:hypothetical protein
MNLVGKRVEGFWGCLHPSSFGSIYARDDKIVKIRWDNGYNFECEIKDLKRGMPGVVGIYVEDSE